MRMCASCVRGVGGDVERVLGGGRGCLKKSGETIEIVFSDQLHGVQMPQRTMQDAGAEV